MPRAVAGSVRRLGAIFATAVTVAVMVNSIVGVLADNWVVVLVVLLLVGWLVVSLVGGAREAQPTEPALPEGAWGAQEPQLEAREADDGGRWRASPTATQELGDRATLSASEPAQEPLPPAADPQASSPADADAGLESPMPAPGDANVGVDAPRTLTPVWSVPVFVAPASGDPENVDVRLAVTLPSGPAVPAALQDALGETAPAAPRAVPPAGAGAPAVSGAGQVPLTRRQIRERERAAAAAATAAALPTRHAGAWGTGDQDDPYGVPPLP